MRAGNYELVEKLGEGGLGEVWKALHTALAGQYRAVKVVKGTDLIGYLRKEANTLARMDHPNIIKVHDFFIEENKGYLVEELFQSVNLRQKMSASGGKLGEIMAEHYARQYLSALAYGHSHPEGPIIHGDFKPENVLIGEKDCVKVVDFGFAVKPGEDQESDVRISTISSKKAFSTPEYMPPEQRAGSKPAPAADVYSAGLTLYESLTGRRMPVVEISPQKLWRISRKAVDPEPGNRYPTAKEMLEDLTKPEERPKEKPSPKTTTLFPAVEKPKSCFTSPAVLGGITAVLLSAGIAFIVSSNSRRNEKPYVFRPGQMETYFVQRASFEEKNGSGFVSLEVANSEGRKLTGKIIYIPDAWACFKKRADTDRDGKLSQEEAGRYFSGKRLRLSLNEESSRTNSFMFNGSILDE